MHKLASQISAFILSPVYWIILLIITGLLFRNKKIKKVCFITATAIFLVFSNPLLLSWLTRQWQGQRSFVDASKKYSCGIVLGGFASMDADEFAYFNGSADRFIQTLKLYKAGEIQHILVSGGNSKREHKTFEEATWVKKELASMGVPDSVIFTEDHSSNTMDNAINSKKILDSLRLPPPYLLITSAYHMPRASLLFSKTGLMTQPYSCNYSAGYNGFSFSLLLPQLNVLNKWENILKETVSYYSYKMLK